jgi:hypothetical protein
LLSNRRVFCGKLSKYAPQFFGLMSVAADGCEVDREEAVPFLNDRRPVGKNDHQPSGPGTITRINAHQVEELERTESRVTIATKLHSLGHRKIICEL